MTRMKPPLWILLGVIVGVSTTALARPVEAQAPSTANERITYAHVTNNFAADLYFIKDKKSGGCWLVSRGASTLSLAVAPAAACD